LDNQLKAAKYLSNKIKVQRLEKVILLVEQGKKFPRMQDSSEVEQMIIINYKYIL
jgi:hypothetical protein